MKIVFDSEEVKGSEIVEKKKDRTCFELIRHINNDTMFSLRILNNRIYINHKRVHTHKNKHGNSKGYVSCFLIRKSLVFIDQAASTSAS